tara:strand:- start:800 stop:1576 length:777 start_codon:yes stop_codon:yes gene_type:complete
MSTLKSPPLIEAIFEVHWGETHPGQFNFSQEEQSLFPIKFSSFASANGFSFQELVNNGAFHGAVLPRLVSHRYRKQADKWPCYQTGLGVFTVNQIADGYDWTDFHVDIKKGTSIFFQALGAQLKDVANTGYAQLKYQDAFFQKDEESLESFLKSTFNVNISLPSSFFDKDEIKKSYSSINFTSSIESLSPKGRVDIVIANAIISGKPGILMETVVTSKISDISQKIEYLADDIMNWSDSAHKLQKHAFSTLIKKSGED